MTKTSANLNGDRAFLLAAVMAAIAAIFMVTVWAPLQIRALTQSTPVAWPGTSSSIRTSAEATTWDRIPFVTADGATTDLAASNGRVRLVTMIYTHCPGVCPLAIATLQRMEKGLNAAQRNKLSVLALSLDPEHDAVEQLREFRQARGIDSRGWTVASPSVEGARTLANALGVSYRVVGDDSVDHQSVFVLIDKSGHLLARSSNTRDVDPKFREALRAALNGN